jgi:predicted DNA-binding antitoxin AbrB/MazE fold protein
MSDSIPAVFENGVFRPLTKVEMPEGEEVEVFLISKDQQSSFRSREILRSIAELPIEGKNGKYSGEDHDEILYPKE